MKLNCSLYYYKGLIVFMLVVTSLALFNLEVEVASAATRVFYDDFESGNGAKGAQMTNVPMSQQLLMATPRTKDPI